MNTARQQINMVSGDLIRRDNTTVYDVSNGARSFIIPFSKGTSFSIQAIWTGLSANDGVLKVYGSNDNSNFDLLPGTATKTMTTASGSWSFIKDYFNWEYIAVEFTPNTVATGTIKLILDIKE